MLALVKSELHAMGYTDDEIDGGGLRVTTTFTQKAMEAAEEGVKEGKPEGFGDKELHVAVASVEPGTGALRGFYGGQDYLDSQINWAVAGGMVGSTFKPFTLATALANGYSLKDTFEGNSPYEFPDGADGPQRGRGPRRQRQRLRDLGQRDVRPRALDQHRVRRHGHDIPDGSDKILEMANKLGIPPAKATRKYPGIPDKSIDLEADALITLGKARVSPINMANAYATHRQRWTAGQRPRDREDRRPKRRGACYHYKQATDEAVGKDIAADVSYAMQQVVKNGTGKAALALGRPAAGKTGTATNDKDEVSSAWFVGYTPQLATAVMYVRGDGDDQLDGWLPSYFGGGLPRGDLDRRDAARHGGAAGRAVPAAGVRRR